MSLHGEVIGTIATRMEELNMSQAELSRRIGWTPKHVNRILGGHAEPSLAALDFIAHILRMELVVTARRTDD